MWIAISCLPFTHCLFEVCGYTSGLIWAVPKWRDSVSNSPLIYNLLPLIIIVVYQLSVLWFGLRFWSIYRICGRLLGNYLFFGWLVRERSVIREIRHEMILAFWLKTGLNRVLWGAPTVIHITAVQTMSVNKCLGIALVSVFALWLQNYTGRTQT